MATFDRPTVLAACLVLSCSFSCQPEEEEEFICRTLDELSEEIMVFGDCADGIDNDEDGDIDCADEDCLGEPECLVNQPPTPPGITIPRPGGPNHPVATDIPMVCVLFETSTDPDGDPLHYRFEWTVDGEIFDYTGNQIDPEFTETGQEWTCAVTAFDGHYEVPSSTLTVIIGDNQPPSQPIVEITPESPNDGHDLDCTILIPSVDPDGDQVTYYFEWVRDGDLLDMEGSEVFAVDTHPGQEWICYVTPTDGMAVGKPGWASVTIN